MIDRIGQRVLAEDTSGRNLVTAIQLSLKCQATYPGSGNLRNAKQFLSSQGQFWIKYKNSGSFLSLVRPFVLYCDIYSDRGSFIRSASWEQLMEDGKKDERVQFLLDYTNISAEHYRIAAENKYAPIPFSFDIVKYEKDVKEKYKTESGTYPKNGVLVDPLLSLAEEARKNAKWERQKEQNRIRRENKLK